MGLILLIIAAAWGWYAWRDIRRAFIGLPILLPTYLVRVSFGPIPTTGLELILLATLLAWVATRGRVTWDDKVWRDRLKTWGGPMLLWFFAGALAVVISPVKLQALGLLRAYFIEPMLVFIIGLDLIRTPEDRRRLATSFGVITIVLGIWAAIQMLTGWGIPHPWDAWPGRRATGPFPYPNALALFVGPIVALAFADRVRVIKSGGMTMLGWLTGWLTVGFGTVAIVCANSEGGLAAIGAAILVALFLEKKTRRYGVALVVLGLLTIMVVTPLRERVVNAVTFNKWSGMVRKVIWKESWTMLTDTTTPLGIGRPLLGAGLAAYPTAILPYHKATWMEVFQYPHNILLNLWSETGLLGILAFGWILWTWVFEKRRCSFEKLQIVLPVMVALLVHGLVDVPYFKNDLAVAFWMLILLTSIYEKDI